VGTTRRTIRTLSSGLALAVAALVLAASPATALPIYGNLVARLMIFGDGNSSCSSSHRLVRMSAGVDTQFGSGQQLIDQGYTIRIEGWGSDPTFDNREFGPYGLRGPQLTSTPDGLRAYLSRCVSKEDLNEDEDGGDELYLKARLYDGRGKLARDTRSNTVRIVVQRSE
jgi:hypothetical protein